MQGGNILTICQAAMVEAVEYYLNQVVLKSPVRVTDVTQNKSNSVFIINIQEPETKKEAQ